MVGQKWKRISTKNDRLFSAGEPGSSFLLFSKEHLLTTKSTKMNMPSSGIIYKDNKSVL